MKGDMIGYDEFIESVAMSREGLRLSIRDGLISGKTDRELRVARSAVDVLTAQTAHLFENDDIESG